MSAHSAPSCLVRCHGNYALPPRDMRSHHAWAHGGGTALRPGSPRAGWVLLRATDSRKQIPEWRGCQTWRACTPGLCIRHERGQGTRLTTKSSVVLPRPDLYLWDLRLCFGRGMPSSDSELDVLLLDTMWIAASSRHARSATLECPAAVAAGAEALAPIGLVTCGMAALKADAKPCGCCGIGVLCEGNTTPACEGPATGLGGRGLVATVDSSTCIRVAIDVIAEVKLCRAAVRSIGSRPGVCPGVAGTEWAPRLAPWAKGALGLKADGPGMGAAGLVDVAVHRTVCGRLKLKVVVAVVSVGAVLVPAAKEDTVSCVLLSTVSLVAMVTTVVVYVLPNDVTVWDGDVTVYILPAVVIFAPSVLQMVFPIVEAMLAEFIFGRILLHLKPVGFGCREPHFQQWRRWLMETGTVRKRQFQQLKTSWWTGVTLYSLVTSTDWPRQLNGWSGVSRGPWFYPRVCLTGQPGVCDYEVIVVKTVRSGVKHARLHIMA